MSGNLDDYAENAESAVHVEFDGSAGRSGVAECAESVRTHVRYDVDVVSVGVVCRGPFHNSPQSPGTHAVVDVSG